ncbi:MAG: CehA/McbA family metallohydrolase [Anaerolineales bacterium]
MFTEVKGNLHIHTTLSDGTGTHAEVAAAARQAGLAWCIVTDHNAVAFGEQGWRDGVLLLVGQELNDPAHPHCNHLLVLGAGVDLAPYAADTAQALAAARAAGGLCLIAHPDEHSAAYSGEPEIPWQRWDLADQVQGLELWNYMSEFKAHLPNAASALALALWPKLAMRGPFDETLARWDTLLTQGPCVGVAGSDAHAIEYRMGPLRRRVFGYEYLFRAVNTHALIEGPWPSERTDETAAMLGQRLHDALRAGRCFVSYDALRDGTGFRFGLRLASGAELPMGSTVHWPAEGTLYAEAPAGARARLELWRDGCLIVSERGPALTWRVEEAGIYRVVARRWYAGAWRTWLLSNAIRLVG